MIKLRIDDETAIPLSVDSSSAVSMTVSEAFIDRGGSAIQNNKNATPSTSQVVVTPDQGFDGMAKVTVAAMPQGEIDPASLSYDTYLLRGRITAEANVTQAGYVPIGGNMARAYCDELLPSENPKTVTPTTSEQTAVDANKWTKGQIKVGPIPPEYVIPTGTKSISANGTGIDVKAYEKVDVAVPGITPSGTLAIATNGSHDVTNYATASVAVPASAVDSGTKSITANGNGQDVVGYAAVNVNVPNSYAAADEGKVVSNGALVSQTSDTVTANDTYDTTLINSLTVNVSGGGGGSNYVVVEQVVAGTNTVSKTCEAGQYLLGLCSANMPHHAVFIQREAGSPSPVYNEFGGLIKYFDLDFNGVTTTGDGAPYRYRSEWKAINNRTKSAEKEQVSSKYTVIDGDGLQYYYGG